MKEDGSQHRGDSPRYRYKNALDDFLDGSAALTFAVIYRWNCQNHWRLYSSSRIATVTRDTEMGILCFTWISSSAHSTWPSVDPFLTNKKDTRQWTLQRFIYYYAHYYFPQNVTRKLKRPLSVLMLCAPNNRWRPFSYHMKMADFVYFRVLSVFSWKNLI